MERKVYSPYNLRRGGENNCCGIICNLTNFSLYGYDKRNYTQLADSAWMCNRFTVKHPQTTADSNGIHSRTHLFYSIYAGGDRSG